MCKWFKDAWKIEKDLTQKISELPKAKKYLDSPQETH
jgi:hypothetical protein